MSAVTKHRSHETLNEAGQFVQGVASSTTMLGVMMPIDALATRKMGKLTQPSSLVLPASGAKSTSAVQVAMQALKNGYRGFPITVLSVAPNMGVSYAAYARTLRYLAPEGNPTESQKNQATGVSTLISASLVTVTDRVKVIQQLSGGSVKQVVMTTVRNEGLRSLVKGFWPTTVREGAFLYFLFNIQGKVQQGLPSCLEDVVVRSALAGGITGATVGLLTTPPARVKTLMQGDVKGEFPSSWDTIRKLVKEEGFGGLFKGKGARAGFVGGALATMAVTNQYFPPYFPASLHRT